MNRVMETHLTQSFQRLKSRTITVVQFGLAALFLCALALTIPQ